MLAEERYKKIVEIVNERGSIRVSELSQIFSVTEETIRRDLAKLEGEEKLIRSHGGAVSTGEKQPELSYSTREIMNVEEKKKIALETINHISPNDRIFLDASTTAWYTASIIPNIPLTVLTNSLKVALELVEKDKIEVISIGGTLSQRSLSFIGPLAEMSLDAYFVDKAFISCKGVHLKRGISDSIELQAKIKQKVINLSDKVYLMADASKFGVQALKKISSFECIDNVITNKGIDQTVINELKEIGVSVFLANS
ncbi:DeoR/GlpR family DNA-binding transcription regulator [Evansella sp. AB-rgal1]|uniref:DeoR/GlpR family DNA-binding transcription regulator n=1 Tax=Evansella sp. AB-rgal1 TaxID=3242696 RepID=UPI00359CC960